MQATLPTRLPDGRDIAERAPAKVTGIGRNRDAVKTLVNASQILLDDGTVTNLCDDPDCWYMNENPRSVFHHQQKHAVSHAAEQPATRERGVTDDLIRDVFATKARLIEEHGLHGWIARTVLDLNTREVRTQRGQVWTKDSLPKFTSRYAERSRVLLSRKDAPPVELPPKEPLVDIVALAAKVEAGFPEYSIPSEPAPVLNGAATVSDPAGVFREEPAPSKLKDLIDLLVELEEAIPELIEALTLAERAAELEEKARKYDEMRERFFA